MRVEHDNTNGKSRQYYKGILSGKSQATFSGRIVVAQKAQKTDAVQSNQNLLLSEDARAFSKPQLEIYADDVKCTHGATIGEIDESAVFYLRSRGMTLEVAKALLLHAFVSESLERMALEPVRRFLESLAIDRLPNGDILREFL
jgi:Fe-S cluster assembly protein SufD